MDPHTEFSPRNSAEEHSVNIDLRWSSVSSALTVVAKPSSPPSWLQALCVLRERPRQCGCSSRACRGAEDNLESQECLFRDGNPLLGKSRADFFLLFLPVF